MNLKKNNFLLIVLIAIIVSGCTGSYKGSTGSSQSNGNDGSAANASNQGTAVNGVLDCGADMSCFSEAASTCTPAKVQWLLTSQGTGSAPAVGTLQTVTYYSELSQKKDTTCKYYQEGKSVLVKFTDEKKQSMLASGKTEAEVAAEEVQVQEDYSKSFNPFPISCRFEDSKLVELLAKWENGNLTLADFAGCSPGNVDVSKLSVKRSFNG
ncbi:MAG: hypothetical protein Q7S92_05340 [Candidatus Diapherotrites archaeon]|nr:hypothetical protein [Candidatus Diapherotrites archaeon]